MPTRRSSFGADCAHCGKELIAQKGPSIAMSDTSFIFGGARNATAHLVWGHKVRN
jgi:hypothetical protein